MKANLLLERTRSALAETRQELGLSRSALARCAGVSVSTVVRAENGGPVHDNTVVRLASTLTVLELCGKSVPEPPPDWLRLPVELEVAA
jgi:transcriptional regulator with XRE-family HTH domain